MMMLAQGESPNPRIARVLSQAERNELVHLYAEGASDDLRRRFGIGWRKLDQAMRELGIERRPPGGRRRR